MLPYSSIRSILLEEWRFVPGGGYTITPPPWNMEHVTNKQKGRSLVHRHPFDVNPVVKVNRPATNYVTTANNLFNVFKNLTIVMVYEFILWYARTSHNDVLRIPKGEASLVLDFERIAIEDTEEEVHATVGCTEIINDSSLLTVVAIEPTKPIAGDPDAANSVLKGKLGLPTSGRPSIPDDIRLVLTSSFALELQERFKALMILDKNDREFLSQV